MRRLGLLLIAVASLGGLCGPRFMPPAPDACDSPSGAAVTTLEIGTGDDSSFVALHDDDVVQLAIGGQGGRMLPVRLRVGGAPACLMQTTTVSASDPFSDGGALTPVARDMAPLKTYAQPDGTFLTKPDYLVLSLFPGPVQPLLVHVDAGGQTATVRVWPDMRVYDGGQ